MATNVIMYSVPICPKCLLAKRFLTAKGIPFEERNVLTSGKYRREMKELTDVMTVPVTKIGNRVVVGYHQPEFTEAVALLK